MRSYAVLTALLLAGTVLSGCTDDPPDGEAAPGPTPSVSPSAGATVSPSARASASPSAGPSPTARATGTPAAAPAPSTTARPGPSSSRAVRLTGDGIDLPGSVVPFGTPVEQARPLLAAGLGAPTLDTGEVSSFGAYGTCPGTRLRALEHGGGALVVLFGDVGGPELTMYAWTLTERGSPDAVPQASALVGDVTTFDFGVGTSLAELRDGAGDAVQVTDGDELLPPSFRLQDQSAGFLGSLTGTGPADTVTFVLGGQGCGE